MQSTLASVITFAQTQWIHLSAAAMKDTHWLAMEGHARIPTNVKKGLTTVSKTVLMFPWEVALSVTASTATN